MPEGGYDNDRLSAARRAIATIAARLLSLGGGFTDFDNVGWVDYSSPMATSIRAWRLPPCRVTVSFKQVGTRIWLNASREEFRNLRPMSFT